MKIDRLTEMENFICQRGSASMEELRGRFQISMNTVRRDVAALCLRGTVEKVYGGVRARRSEQTLTPYEVRRMDHEAAKLAIGRRAARLVQDGDILFLDSGTTTVQMMDFLKERRELTIITNNLEAIIRALPYDNLNIIALPGQLRRKTNSFTSDDAVRSLKRYNVRTAFMAATGVSMHGVTNSSPMEYEIKRAAMEICERSVLLINGRKFGVTGLMSYAALTDFHAVVTDGTPPAEYTNLMSKGNTTLLVAEDSAIKEE